MRRFTLFLAASSLASLAAAQAPTPPVAPPPPQPGAAEPMTQAKPANMSPAPQPDATKKDAKWDVNARHAPGHDAQIDTRTGTWMSVDVSPDGKEIAFDLLGDVYTIPISGGEARPLATGNAWEMQPRYSPDGREIAFTSDRSGKPQIYIMNAADGSNVRRLTVNESYADRATWSPAPFNEIAYTAQTGEWYDIKIHELATGTVRQITFGEGSNEGPAYSSNGKHLAFTSTRAGGTQVFTIGRDGRGLKQITRSGNNQTPAWSQ